METEIFDCPVCYNRNPSCTICRYYRHKHWRKPYQSIAWYIKANYTKEVKDEVFMQEEETCETELCVSKSEK